MCQKQNISHLMPQILRNRVGKVSDDIKQAQEVKAKRTAKNSVFLKTVSKQQESGGSNDYEEFI